MRKCPGTDIDPFHPSLVLNKVRSDTFEGLKTRLWYLLGSSQKVNSGSICGTFKGIWPKKPRQEVICCFRTGAS